MSIKQNAIDRIAKTRIGKRIVKEQRYQMILTAALGFFLNLLYALYYGVLGIINLSFWFITMCAYYIILSTMRFSALLCERKSNPTSCADTEYFVMKLSGVLLAILSFVLTGVIYISLSQNIATNIMKSS